MNRLTDYCFMLLFVIAFFGVATRIDPASDMVYPFANLSLVCLYFIFIAFERRRK